MAASGTTKPTVGIVGPGSLGTALAIRLKEVGYRIIFVVARERSSARGLADRLGAASVGLSEPSLEVSCDLLFCCIPDDAISGVAHKLVHKRPNWRDTIIAHTSGAAEAAQLDPLRQCGAAIMSFHPLQTFAGFDGGDLFEGIHVALEGDPAAVQMGRRVAEDLGCHHVLLNADTKPLYHLAASTASNSLGVLVAMAQEILNTIGIDSKTAIQMLQPLVDQTWLNIQRYQPEQALTGPVVRGDVTTIELHIAAIQRHAPHLAPAFAALVTEAVRLSVRSGRLHIEPADAILERIHALLTGGEV